MSYQLPPNPYDTGPTERISRCDRDEDGLPMNPFFSIALPCESCGEPTEKDRVWNAEYELWVAVDCSCNEPDLPVCPLLIPALEAAELVSEVCQVIRDHRKTCPLCKPVKMKPATREIQPIRKDKEAA